MYGKNNFKFQNQDEILGMYLANLIYESSYHIPMKQQHSGDGGYARRQLSQLSPAAVRGADGYQAIRRKAFRHRARKPHQVGQVAPAHRGALQAQ